MSAVVPQFLERVIFHINGPSHMTTTAMSIWYVFLILSMTLFYQLNIISLFELHDGNTT
jgi:hypothetical protein